MLTCFIFFQKSVLEDQEIQEKRSQLDSEEQLETKLPLIKTEKQVSFQNNDEKNSG